MTDNTPRSVKNAALLVATLVSFIVPFTGSASNIAFPMIGSEFELDAIVLGWVATSFLISSAVFLIPFGRIADIHGRKRVFVTGITVFTLSSAGCGFSTSAWMLIMFRVMQGLGSSMIFGTGMAILTSVFEPGERGRALGINLAAVYLGLSTGPFFGGLLTQHLGWRSIFLINVPLGAIVIIATLARLKGEWAEAKDESVDAAGSILYALALIMIMYGLSTLPAYSGFILMAVGAVVLAVFVRFEKGRSSPVLNMELFRKNPVFVFSNLAALINYGATFAVGFLMSLYLQYLRGYTPQQAGLILAAQPAVMMVLSPFAGKLSDRIEPGIVASIGMAFTTAGLVMLFFVNDSSGLLMILSSFVVLGFGFGFFSSPNTNAIMSSVQRKYFGVASAMVGTMRNTGMMISMGVAMILFSLIMGRVQITPEHHAAFLQCMKIAFGIFSFLCFGGIFASLARGKMH